MWGRASSRYARGRMAGDAEVFAKEHVGPVVAALGFSRRERAFVRIAPSGTVAVVVGVVGSRFNVPRAYSDALGVPNQVEVTIQLYAGVAIPPSPKKMLTAFPQAVGQTPAAACAYGWKRSYRVRDDGLNPAVEAMNVAGPQRMRSDLAAALAELVALDSVDDVLRYCADREGAKPFMLATLLAALHRADEARALFRHPSSGDPSLVARHAARYGIDLGA